MNLVYENIWKAIGYIFISGIVYFAWSQAYELTIKVGWKKGLLKGLGICFGIAAFAALMLGTASCEEKSDPVYGGCDQYADDGYEATTEQRLAQFAYFMVLLGVPVGIGVYKGKDELGNED